MIDEKIKEWYDSLPIEKKIELIWEVMKIIVPQEDLEKFKKLIEKLGGKKI